MQALLTAIVCLTFVGTGVLALRLRAVRAFWLSSHGNRLYVADRRAPRGERRGRLHGGCVRHRTSSSRCLVHALLAFPQWKAALDEPASARCRRLRRRARPAGCSPSSSIRSPAITATIRRTSRCSIRRLRSPPASRSWRRRSQSVSRSRWCSCSRAACARATPAARRQLLPVLIGGSIALLFFSFGLVLAPLSSGAGRSDLGSACSPR